MYIERDKNKFISSVDTSLGEIISKIDKNKGNTIFITDCHGKLIGAITDGDRPGDAAKVWADVSRAKEKIGFRARLGAPEMCRDTWRWQSANPNGYQKT